MGCTELHNFVWKVWQRHAQSVWFLSRNRQERRQTDLCSTPKWAGVASTQETKQNIHIHKKSTKPPKQPKISQIETENIFAQVLLHLVHPVTFTVTEHLFKSCIFNVYFNTFWLASLYRIAPWQECVYVCASDLMLFFLVISKGVW